MSKRFAIFIFFAFISLQAFAVPAPDFNGTFYTAKEDLTATSVFGDHIGGYVTHVEAKLPLTIQRGQVIAFKYDVWADMYYFEAERPVKNKTEVSRVYFSQGEIDRFFGKPVSNGSREADDQLKPQYQAYPGGGAAGTRAIHIVSLDDGPYALATDLGPNHITATGRNYIHDVHLANDGKTKIRVFESKVIPLPVDGVPRWTMVQRVCIRSSFLEKDRCGWVVAGSIFEQGEPHPNGVCDLGSPPGAGTQARQVTDIARASLAIQPPKPRQKLIPDLFPQAAKPEIPFNDAIGRCALDDPSRTLKESDLSKYNAGNQSVYVKMLQPKVKALYPNVINPSHVTPDQFEAIDLLARTLYGEIRGCTETDGPEYAKAVARIIYNRAHASDREKEFQRSVLPVADPSSKVILSERAFSMWNNINEVGRSKDAKENHLSNLTSSLCPEIESTPKGDKAWAAIKEIAKEMVLNPAKFAAETKSLDGVFFYTSDNAKISDLKEIKSRPSIGGRVLASRKCLDFWRDKTPADKQAELEEAKRKAAAAAKKKSARKKK